MKLCRVKLRLAAEESCRVALGLLLLCPKWGRRGPWALVAYLALLSPPWEPGLALLSSGAYVLGTVVRTVQCM